MAEALVYLKQVARFAAPEVQFMTFAEDGTGAFAELHGTRLELRWRLPEDADRPLPERPPILLDHAFPVGFDFVQDVRIEDGVFAEQEKLIDNLARIRDIEVNSNGEVLLLLEHASGGRIVKLVPSS